MSSSAAAAPSPSASSDISNIETLIQPQDTPSDALNNSQPAENSATSNSPSDAEELIIVSMEGDLTKVKGGEEEEEEEECGFCIFMKGGGCKEEFVAWEKCVEGAEKAGVDIVDSCMQVSILLKKCMDAHSDYYEPILKAEQEMENSISDLEKEKEPEKQVDK